MELETQSNNLSSFSMKELLSKSEFDLPKIGQTMAGEIISISKNSVLIDLGTLGTGIVYPGEFYDNPNLQKSLKSGQIVSAILLDLENDEGYRELSLKRAQKTTAWQDIKSKKESGEILETKIMNINKGGLIVEINGVQGFLPLSQLNAEHYPKVEGGDTTKIVQTLQKLRNQEIKVKIIDYSEEEGRLIVSERAINDNETKERISKLNVGNLVDAEITDVTDFGAFASIQIPGEETENTSKENSSEQTNGQKNKIEGLIHISEIDWKLIENPRDFLKTGDKVKAKIISIEGGKISLSLKALKPDPWEKIEGKYLVGQKLEGQVARISNYGVFVQLDEEIIGLIPSSEFTEKKASDTLKAGEKINIAIVSVDAKDHKMLLTIQK